jgi:DNA-binding protein H-NS
VKQPNLVIKQIGSMSFDELLIIKAKVEAEIDARIHDERRRLEASLQKLDALSQDYKGGRLVHSRKVAPKYRNPENPVETWTGRGLMPRWMTAALKGGKKKREDFAIAQRHDSKSR